MRDSKKDSNFINENFFRHDGYFRDGEKALNECDRRRREKFVFFFLSFVFALPMYWLNTYIW